MTRSNVRHGTINNAPIAWVRFAGFVACRYSPLYFSLARVCRVIIAFSDRLTSLTTEQFSAAAVEKIAQSFVSRLQSRVSEFSCSENRSKLSPFLFHHESSRGIQNDYWDFRELEFLY